MRIFLATVLTACVAALPGALPQAVAGDTGQYVGGGTAVARVGGTAVADEGFVVCDDGSGVGVGGFCLGFGNGDAVRVGDKVAGHKVAFQVCVDNSGDGICTSPDFGPCADFVAFSHDDDGSFYNPVGPLPTGFSGPNCGGGLAFPGYVVFLCEGAHVAGADVHAHAATTGTGGVVTSGGLGSGNFCGGDPVQSFKPYVTTTPQDGPGGEGYRGGCAVAAARDRTPNEAGGGQDGVYGTVSITIAATDAGGAPDPLAPVDARCDLFNNGVLVQYDVLSASGTGAVVTAARVQYQATENDHVTVCTDATVRGVSSYVCAPAREA